MTFLASRELRIQTRKLLDRVASGERITITVGGRPVALLSPVTGRDRWMPRETFWRKVPVARADPALRDELDSLAPDTTDDLES